MCIRDRINVPGGGQQYLPTMVGCIGNDAGPLKCWIIADGNQLSIYPAVILRPAPYLPYMAGNWVSKG